MFQDAAEVRKVALAQLVEKNPEFFYQIKAQIDEARDGGFFNIFIANSTLVKGGVSRDRLITVIELYNYTTRKVEGGLRIYW